MKEDGGKLLDEGGLEAENVEERARIQHAKITSVFDVCSLPPLLHPNAVRVCVCVCEFHMNNVCSI